MTVTRTENNAKAYVLRSNCLEFFSKIGGLRRVSIACKIQMFIAAAKEDAETAVKILFWGRDARKGAGERKTFHDIMEKCINPDFIARNVNNIINTGYAKDVIPYLDSKYDIDGKILSNYVLALTGDEDVRQALVAKWTPRKGPVFKAIRNRMKLTNKQLRKFLTENSSTVEQMMSSRKWKDIEYQSVPGAAMRKYNNAFNKQDNERFEEWKIEKSSKASVSATYPHDIMKTAMHTRDWDLAQKMWDNLPKLSGSVNPIIMADTSGSMNGLPMLVSCALGLFCAEQLPGHFNGKVITFSGNPQFHDLNEHETLEMKWKYLYGNHEWDMSTNFEAAFMLLLDLAKFFGVINEHMPKMMICISDMQFNEAKHGVDQSLHEGLKDAYRELGYDFPKLVYWNVRASFGSPAEDLSEHTALISGFNPAVINPLLEGDIINPMRTMYDSIENIVLDFTHDPLKDVTNLGDAL